jgi:hypothetical protein
MGEAIRWVLCIGLSGLFGLFLVGNWLFLLGTARTKKPTSLVFPFVNGPVCALACLFSPSPFLRAWFWVPLALDFTLFALIGIGVAAAVRFFCGSVADGDAARRELLAVLREARSLLAIPGTDFAWSRWKNAEQALRDMDCLIAAVEVGMLPERMELGVLFAPTGSIQEVSVSSGWGEEFLALANRFDEAARRVFA